MNFHNDYHLGDCLFTIHYLNKLQDQIKKDLNFYCDAKYHDELSLWIENPGIKLCDIKDKSRHSINTWLGLDDFYHSNKELYNHKFDRLYNAFFNKLTLSINYIDLVNPIKTINDLLFDNYKININNKLNKNFDFFIINSKPLSGQVDENAIKNLNCFVENKLKSYNVISTEPINSMIECTRDYGMSLIDIANLSTRCDYIIGIHTAPMLVCFNKFNINNVKQWIILQKDGLTYSFNNRISNIKDSSKLLF